MSKITGKLISEITGLQVDPAIQFEAASISTTQVPGTLCFLDDKKYARDINVNPNITGVIITSQLADLIDDSKIKIASEDPRYDFYTLLNYLGERDYKKIPTVIHPTANIHPRAYVAEHNVVIGANTIIEPNVTILEDVEIGANCIIRAGSVIGAEGFEQKRTKKGILWVKHFGKVIIHDNVHIGALNGISKGIFFRDTIVGESCRTDNLVHIAHCVQIGKRCFFPASCMVAGSVTIGDDVWIGPNASISSGIQLHDRAFATIGSVVTRDVQAGEAVTGNFAIPHSKFLRNLKKMLE
jgi:UDP-3-O-[3-hydroxymyristoyl] glucosamine N-acyltransferase